MLKAHGVDVSGVTAERLSGLPIRGGTVDAPFDYTPPKVSVPKATETGRAEGSPPLTLDEVRKWPPDEINRRWAEVKAVMRAAGAKT